MKGAKIIKKEPFISENTKSGLLKFKRSQLCIPYGLFLSFFVIFPLFLIIYYAFTSKTGEFSFSNFTAFFVETTNISTLIISIFVSFIVTLICLLISYPVAYILSRLKNSNLAFVLLLLFILPTWLNFVLRAMAMKELLSFIGVPLGSAASIIGLVYDFMPFMIMPLYSTLIKMDKSFEEAAADLGASKVKVFSSISLLELIHTPTSINQFLFASEERMTVAANVHFKEFTIFRRSRFEGCTASARYGHFVIVRMDFRFHFYSPRYSFFIFCASQL